MIISWKLKYLLAQLLPIIQCYRSGNILIELWIMILPKFLIINNVRDKTEGLIKGRESSFMADL